MSDKQIPGVEQASIEDFQELVEASVGQGKCAIRLGISIYRNGNSEEEAQVEPDMMLLTAIKDIPDNVSNMIWNVLFELQQNLHFTPFAMVASEEERKKYWLNPQGAVEAANDGKNKLN